MDDTSFIQSTILALIQGLTEFLPISSSAHLLLPSIVLGWRDQGLAFDVAVHLGTLCAVLFYFRRDVLKIAGGLIRHARTGRASEDSMLGLHLAVATVPVIIAGFLLQDVVSTHLRNAEVIIATTLIFAVVLWLADRNSGTRTDEHKLGMGGALAIGLAQILALIPGTSRSGITMSAALFCGLGREAASRFSFLLAIPVIAGASLLQLLELLAQEEVNWGLLVYATILAMITAWLCIHFFLRYINRIGFLPFVIYRLLLGVFLLILLGLN